MVSRPAATAAPAGELRFATASTRSELARQARAGRAQRLAPGLYALGVTLPPEAAVRQHRFSIIAHYWPGAVLVGKTALAGGEPLDGQVFVSQDRPERTAALALPGLTVHVRDGPGRLSGDMPLPEGLWLSGVARGLVENVHLVGRPRRSRAGTPAVEDRIDELARTGGAGKIQTALAQLDVIAGDFDPAAVGLVRSRLAAVLGTVTPGTAPSSDRLRARLAGDPYDAERLSLLSRFVEALAERAPAPRAAAPDDPRWAYLPFFEAYFSNFIEGTRFGVEEARAIALEGVVPAARPADAHDVAATYRLAANPADVGRVPRSGDELIAILEGRHGLLMGARPDKRPGQLKETDNYAGGYRFVDPHLVRGTLKRGFDTLTPLIDAFARAAAMMVLVTEVHPFDDGNGRVARLAVNAELTAAGQARIVIPTVYRNNYLAGLSAVSNRAGRGEALISVLDYTQRWTTRVLWRSYEEALADLEASNAFVDPGEAEASGTRLQFPWPRVKIKRAVDFESGSSP